MSWSFTVNSSIQDFSLPVDLVEKMVTQHPAYASDMLLALTVAKEMGLKSAVLTGFRTPNPYGGPEVVEISVKGTIDPVDFNALMKDFILSGPECVHEWGPCWDDEESWYGCPKCGAEQAGSRRVIND